MADDNFIRLPLWVKPSEVAALCRLLAEQEENDLVILGEYIARTSQEAAHASVKQTR